MKIFPKNIAKVIQLMYDNGYTNIHYFSAMKAMKKTMSFYKTTLSKFDILKDFKTIDKDEFFEYFDEVYDKEFKNIGNLKYELYGSTENFNDLLANPFINVCLTASFVNFTKTSDSLTNSSPLSASSQES
jgi:hypothetical protein